MEAIDITHKKIAAAELTDNIIRMIGDEWMLITAGSPSNFNTMTASWGTMGVLWNKPVAICFVRPTRHTFKFTEESDFFTLSFFAEEHKSILRFCGAKSGRDANKIEATGLKPLRTENKSVGFEQSRLCIECRKVYFDDLKPENFLKPSTDKDFYPKKDYHRMYIGEITRVYLKS
ncbi:MAG: flavin reductase [Bacteroidales bacterium]|nr:flavin reductase [Bacteroidales bacterium]